MYRLTFTAEWNIARFPSLVGISCIAPRSYWRWIRIAAVVPCCRATPFRIVSIILRSWVRCMRCIRCPRLTRPSIHSRVQPSRVLTSFLSLFTIWTKSTFTRSTYYKLKKKLRYRKTTARPTCFVRVLYYVSRERMCWRLINYFCVMGPESNRIRPNVAK